ncbi:unnamed protein product [Allacma fusca]|uniref:Reverse transcriptase domain-containing protein n=1 Tax=Allacma fusca TaxID=39272 RepID=A0A8J2L1V6_9HEXA|nr:unnamed protein product [Allacma fusca]
MLKGVLQGETLKPTLFTLYIDEIVTIHRKSNVNGERIASLQIQILVYAHDIALTANTPEDLQIQINLISNFFNKNDLSVNLDKTKVMVFGKETVASANTGKKPSTKTNDIDIILTLFYSLVSTIPMYGFAIWGENYLEEIEKLQTQFFRRILGASNFTPRQDQFQVNCQILWFGYQPELPSTSAVL